MQAKRGRVATGGAVALLLWLAAGTGYAQTPPATTLTQDPPAAGSPPGTGTPPAGAPVTGAAARTTLVPGVGDPSNAEEVTLPEKPVLILSGSSPWDGGLKALRSAFGRIDAELARLGRPPAGRPLALFVETSDDTFRFDAMVPVAPGDNPPGPLPDGMRWGTTPGGKAYRFVHKGPYDDVDTTYETITVYLDSRNVLAKDAFLEEYLNDIADPANPDLEVNIYVQPR